MSDNIDKMCFADLIKKGKIRIPQIQRDYAQGRKHKEVNEIRNHFVRSLLLVVTGKKAESQLDFVYGSDRKDAFEPLDGQQRLTTLFILHWVLGFDLLTAEGESILTYETRNTSEAFCKELVHHNAKQFVDEAAEKTKKSSKKAEEERSKPEERYNASKLKAHIYTPSEIIQNRDWFQWGWRFDPTISSMLVMIDTVCEQMDWTLDLNACKARLNNITFNHLDLGKMGMSDELFIKMNARGKLLSDFDKLKSTLEEEIQLQQGEVNCDGEKLADSYIEHAWRENMDGKWIDLFWQKYASSVMAQVTSDDNKKERLAAAKETEKRLKIFLLRMIAIQLFAKVPCIDLSDALKKPDDDDEEAIRLYEIKMKRIHDLYEAMFESSYKVNESDLNDLLTTYQNQLIDWRSNNSNILPRHCTIIDFKELMNDMNLWIIDKGEGQYTDVTALLLQDSFFDNNDSTYFSHLVADNISNDILVTLYSLQCFLKLYPYKPDSEAWRLNFEEWTRMSRNVFKFDNNTDRINKRKDASDAFGAVYLMASNMRDYHQHNGIDLYENNAAVLLFLKQLDHSYKGIDNKSLEEEEYKAKLRLIDNEGTIDVSWTDAIRKAEKNPYLWGQIRCLLHWANGNLETFVKYSNCLTQWINLDKHWNKQELYYNAMLCLQPDCWKSKNRLYEFNKDRDNSIKRYLREEPEFGESVCLFIKTWIDWNSQASFEDFCRYAVESTQNKGWVKYFKKRPNIIWESWRKRLYENNGHVIFAQQKTIDSHCIDPMLRYIKSLADDVFYIADEKKWMKDVAIELHDSKSLGSHGLVISTPNHNCEIRWGDGIGEYVITKDDTTLIINDIDELVSTMAETIDQYKTEYNNYEKYNKA